jgi:phage repressor protein C with HTH and peptisase S24 domain
MTEKEKIKNYLDYKGISKNRFYQETGLSMGFLDSGNSIGVDKAKIIINKYPYISLDWLILGEGSMLKGEEKAVATHSNSSITGIPLLPINAFAGMGGDFDSFSLSVIEERYAIPLFKNIKVDFMVQVTGSSMSPKYSSGDVVACRFVSELLYVQWNKVYVLDTETQGVILKRLKKSTQDGFITCKSDNVSYEDFDVPLSDVRKIALVVGVVRME